MSTDALSFAKSRRAGNPGRKATLMIAADVCDEYGVMFGGVAYLAKVLECHRDTVINHPQRLEQDGHLERIRRFRADGRQTTSLLVLAPRDAHRGAMLDPRNHPEYGELIAMHLATTSGSTPGKSRPGDETESGSSTGKSRPGPHTESGFTPDEVGIYPGPSRDFRPNTSTDTSANTSSVETPATVVRFRNARVPDETVAGAERLLAVFCDETGRRLSTRTAQGKPTPALTQAIGAMLDRPEATVEQWEAGIRAVAAQPPQWVTGPLQPGHVFGARAADWTLTAATAPSTAPRRHDAPRSANAGDSSRFPDAAE
jgi:hypothetical protein